MKSCLYHGTLRHRRFGATPHSFRYGLFMMYLDLAELPTLFDRFWLWSARRAAVARFRRSDHLRGGAANLDTAVRDLVYARTGRRPTGPIRLLTHLRYFGHNFNPVSIYYCFDERDLELETVIAEINNTPWGEQHCYVLPVNTSERAGRAHRFQFGKDFHVSPFLPMNHDYDWRIADPGASLNVHMSNECAGEHVFAATLTLKRQEISSAALAGALLRFPLMTVKVVSAIYWQALRLWIKRAPFYANPKHADISLQTSEPPHP